MKKLILFLLATTLASAQTLILHNGKKGSNQEFRPGPAGLVIENLDGTFDQVGKDLIGGTTIGGGGSMTWPSTPGITVCTGTPCAAWTTSLAAPAGTVVGTSDTQVLTNKDLTSITNNFPTFNQSTTGNAATASAVPWSGITNGSGNLAITPGGTSIFSATTPVSQFFAFKNTTAALVGASQSSPFFSLCGTEWHSAASVEGCATLQFIPGTGLDAANTISVAHSGSATGVTTTQFPGPVASGNDAVHAGYLNLVGNTANSSVAANTAGFMGPTSASFTAYALQLPSTGPTTTTASFLNCATPSSSVSACSFGAIPLGSLANQSNATFLSNVSGGPAVPSANALPTTLNALIKTNSANGALAASSVVDNGTTVTSSDTGGYVAPVFVANGTTAGFIDFPQGTTSSAVAPCNTATSICMQAPTAVTSYLVTLPGAAPAQNGSLKSTTTAGVESYVHTIPANTDPNAGIYNFNQAVQSQVVVSGTEYYITQSDLDMPATYSTAIGAGTTMRWHIQMQKTAAGTGSFQILLKKGTNGTTADTSIVTTTVGATQTAAADNLTLDITLTWTSATAAYWSISPRQLAATATGFGLVYPAVALDFNGTISAQTTTTASDKYGISFISTTGTPTITVTQVQAQAYGVN